ncbi:tetratricopeptide repeat protein [bacterium]|nr:tetratricopeptide repeat protein [bacterium]
MLILFLILPALGHADVIHLKTGRNIIGVIEDDSDPQTVAIRSAGARISVQRNTIARIERRPRTELEGDAAMARGDVDAAVDLFQRALGELPNDSQIRSKLDSVRKQLAERDRKRYGAHFDAIEQLLVRKQYARALQDARDLEKQVQEPSTKRRVQIMMSRACMGLAQDARNRLSMQEAEEQVKQAARCAPFYPPPLLELARLYDQPGPRRSAAIVLYQQALEQARTQSDTVPAATLNTARFRLGQLLFDQGKIEESLRQFMELARGNQLDNFPPAADYIDQAITTIYAQDGTKRADELSGYLGEIIKLKPGDDRALALLGRIKYDQGQYDEALGIFRRVVTLTGNNYILQSRQDAGYYPGLIYRKRGDLDKAVASLEPIATAQTRNYNALCELGEINLDQNLFEKALARFKIARLLHADRFRASLGMGQALVYLKNYDDAREYLNEVLARDPENIKALTALAHSYFEEKKFNEVLDKAGKVVQIIETQAGNHPTPDQVSKLIALRTMLGTACTRVNQIFMGRSHFEKVLQLKPDSAPALSGIGEAYQLETNYEKADEFFRKAMEADPKNPQYPLNIALNWQKYRQSPQNALPYYKKYYELGGHDPSVRQWYIEAGGSPEN